MTERLNWSELKWSSRCWMNGLSLDLEPELIVSYQQAKWHTAGTMTVPSENHSVCPTLWPHELYKFIEFSRQECWSGLPCPPPGELPTPGIESRSPTLQADSLLSKPQGSPDHLSDTHFFKDSHPEEISPSRNLWGNTNKWWWSLI